MHIVSVIVYIGRLIHATTVYGMYCSVVLILVLKFLLYIESAAGTVKLLVLFGI